MIRSLKGGNFQLFPMEKAIELNDLDKDFTENITLKQCEDEMNYISNNWKLFEKDWQNITRIIQPYDGMKKKLIIQSEIVETSTKEVRPTNAFMKMYEGMILLDELGWIQKQTKISLLDLASAPGMFILAVEQYIKNNHNMSFEWLATSYIPEGDELYLQDEFGIYRKNPKQFLNANILTEEGVKSIIDFEKDRRINLITGDIGIPHGYEESQEIQHHYLQWGQAYVATERCSVGGAIFLKMYSHIYPTSTRLLNSIRSCFDRLYIIKPQTSRVFNHESYILGVDRNNKTLNMTPILKELISDTSLSESERILRGKCISFHYDLAVLGNMLVNKEYKKEISERVRKWKDDMEKINKYLIDVFYEKFKK